MMPRFQSCTKIKATPKSNCWILRDQLFDNQLKAYCCPFCRCVMLTAPFFYCPPCRWRIEYCEIKKTLISVLVNGFEMTVDDLMLHGVYYKSLQELLNKVQLISHLDKLKTKQVKNAND